MNSNSTDIKKIRKFGVIVVVFFGLLCILGLWKQKPLPFYFFGLLSTIGLGFIIIPKFMKPIYKFWFKVTHIVGITFTSLVLILAYYFVITPSAILKRIFGGTPLPIRPNKNSSSYWVTRTEPAQPKERYAKRY